MSLSVGDSGTERSQSTPRKQHVEDIIHGWTEALVAARASEVIESGDLHLRSDQLKLSRDKPKQKKLDRQHSREGRKKLWSCFSDLAVSRNEIYSNSKYYFSEGGKTPNCDISDATCKGRS